MCNIKVTNTKLLPNGHDGIDISGNYNVLERITVTYCTDEGIGVLGGSYGNVVAFCRVTNCGSTTDQGNGRGMAVWYGASATVVGNYVADSLRGILFGDYNSGSFVDFRNNFVYNNGNYNVNVNGTYGCKTNLIDNLITNGSAAGIKYTGTPIPEVYKSGNTLLNNHPDESGSYTPASTMFTQTNTPFPNWLNNVTTPTSSTDPGVGMGTGKCQCVLCR